MFLFCAKSNPVTHVKFVNFFLSFSPSPPQTADILITLPSKGLKLYEEAMIKVAFKNPLGKRLTNGKFSLYREGYVQDATVDFR